MDHVTILCLLKCVMDAAELQSVSCWVTEPGSLLLLLLHTKPRCLWICW
jgi:hypothetical protein